MQVWIFVVRIDLRNRCPGFEGLGRPPTLRDFSRFQAEGIGWFVFPFLEFPEASPSRSFTSGELQEASTVLGEISRPL